MKLIPYLMLLLFAPVNSLDFKSGTYKAVSRKRHYRDTVARLTLNQDQTFTREYMTIKMCLSEKEWDVGTWVQLGDTLLLTDTLFYPSRLKPTIKRIFGTEDTAIVRTAIFKIKKDKLKFLCGKAGKLQHYLPDYEFESEKENKRSPMRLLVE